MIFDFDKVIDRSESHSLKFDARKAYFGRDDVLPMWVADMDFAVPPAVSAALEARAAHPVFGYTLAPDSLYEAMINWCQKRYDWSMTQKQIVLCPGVVPSIHAAIIALTQPGDNIIVQPPVYFPFFSAVAQTGRSLVLNPLRFEDGRYTMDYTHLEHCAQQGAKLLVLCSPHNPVGRVWTKAELEQLLTIARRYNLTIIADEIHADLVYPGYQHYPLASLTQDVPIITTLAPSKTFNIPGLGLSAVVVQNSQQKTALNAVFESWHVSASNPFSLVAFEAAYRNGEQWLDALRLYLQQTLNWVSDFFASELPQLTLIQPQGTYLLWLDCRKLALDDEALRQFFIDKAGVGMNAGIVFGDAGSGFMRLNIGTPLANVQQACRQIKQALQPTND